MKYSSILLLLIALFGCSKNSFKESYGFFVIKEYGKFGYINNIGETVIPCSFNKADDFSEGLAAGYIDSLWGYIDTTGSIIIQPQFIGRSQFSDGLALVIIRKDTQNLSAFINTKGDVVFETNYERQNHFNFGRALVKINDEICFINKKGDVVINTHYPYGSGFKEGIAHLWTGDHTKYIDTSGNIIIELDGMGHGDFSEGYANAYDQSCEMYIDKTGKKVFEVENDLLTYFDFSCGLAQATLSGRNHKSGFIDTTGKIVIPIQYSDINAFHDGLAAFRAGYKWGFIDKAGDTAIYPQFNGADYDGFRDGLCWVSKDRQGGYINKKGEFVWKEEIDIQYNQIDLAKWDLDTLVIYEPPYGGKYGGRYNPPRKYPDNDVKSFVLRVDTTSDLTVFNNKYIAYKLFLINGSSDSIKIPAQDNRIEIVQQALNEEGAFQDIENFYNSWCGNSYHHYYIRTGEYQVFAAPITSGSFETKLRFKLELKDTIIYSNEYIGRINKGQFLEPEEKDDTEIMVWSN